MSGDSYQILNAAYPMPLHRIETGAWTEGVTMHIGEIIREQHLWKEWKRQYGEKLKTVFKL